MVPTVSYITAAEVKAQSLITGLKTGAGVLEDSDIETLIAAAEDMIDAYVGPQEHHPEDSNIDRVFPRVQDFYRTNEDAEPETPVIPYKVSRACLRQVEWLYTQWWSSRATAQLPVQYPVYSREIGGDGSYSETRARGGINFNEASLCDQSKALLNGFVSRMAGISVSDPDFIPLPT